MVVVDTNVLVYAADRDSPQHDACRDWLEGQRLQAGAWYATWPIAYEFLRVTTHSRVMRKPWRIIEAWTFIEALLGSPGFSMLSPTPRHPSVAKEVLAEQHELSGNLLHDAHTAILMREHGIRRICTRDMDFHRFTFLEVVDPLRS